VPGTSGGLLALKWVPGTSEGIGIFCVPTLATNRKRSEGQPLAIGVPVFN